MSALAALPSFAAACWAFATAFVVVSVVLRALLSFAIKAAVSLSVVLRLAEVSSLSAQERLDRKVRGKSNLESMLWFQEGR